jgi:hypothetical protein
MRHGGLGSPSASFLQRRETLPSPLKKSLLVALVAALTLVNVAPSFAQIQTDKPTPTPTPTNPNPPVTTTPTPAPQPTNPNPPVPPPPPAPAHPLFGDFTFIKTKNTGSGHVEVNTATAASLYQNVKIRSSAFSSLDADYGWFQMVGSDLYFIKTRIPRGFVEVHSATAESDYQNVKIRSSAFSSLDADNGWFQMVGADLYFIKTKHTGSGRVEVHVATAASGYQHIDHHTSWFSPLDADNGWFQMVGSDLYFIKTRNTGSGHVEVHVATAASAYQLGQHNITRLSPQDADNGWFQMAGRDLILIRTKNTRSRSGNVELLYATAASGYGAGGTIETSVSSLDANNGWFQIGNKG